VYNELGYRYVSVSQGIHQHSYNLVHSTQAYLPVKMEQTERSETSAYKLQPPGNYPKESIQHLEHGESLKSRKLSDLYLKFLTLR
jgi:hypothetical protein